MKPGQILSQSVNFGGKKKQVSEEHLRHQDKTIKKLT